MNEHDQRAQFREAPEPEEGTRAAPKIVFAWIAILIVWGVGYYAWQIGKPVLGGDSRTPVAAEHQQSKSADVASSDTSESADTPTGEASNADESGEPGATSQENSDTAETSDTGDTPDTTASEDSTSSNTASASVDGEALFSAHCSSCHQATGQGIPGAFPPLAGSKWLQADPNIPVAIVHDGLEGEIKLPAIRSRA